MAIVSFTNSGKLINRQYVTSTYSKGTNSIDKLSQGKKIRKTSDSVAESSINSKLVNEVAVLKQSMINSMTYKSKLETAASGLEQIDKILGEMQRISYKASSYIGTDDDREKLSAEFEELKNHIDFIVDETRYNGDYLLNSLESSQKASTLWKYKFKLKAGADLDTAYFSTRSGTVDATGPYRKLINLKTGEYEIAKYDGKLFKFPNMKIEFEVDPNTAMDFIRNNYFSALDTDVYISDMTDVSSISDNFRPTHGVKFEIKGARGSKSMAQFVISENKDKSDPNSKVYPYNLVTQPEYLYSDYFDFWKQKPLKNVEEIVLKNPSNKRFKFMKIHLPEVIRNFTRINGGSSEIKANDLDQSGTYSGNGNLLYKFCFYGLVIPKKTHDPKEYSISYVPGSKYNEKFSISSSTALDIGLREDGINLNNEENIKKSIEQVKKAKEIISESISKISVALNRVDFTMNNIDTMMVNTESAISAITDLDVSDELAKLSVLEMQQVSATEMIAHDIKSKYKLLKI